MTSGGHIDQKGAVDLATHGGELGIERHSLGGVAREAVEDEALLGVIGGKALLDKVDHELVGNELASVHVLLSLNTKLGATLDGSTQQVARGNVATPNSATSSCATVPLPAPGAPSNTRFMSNPPLAYLKNPS